MRAHLPRSRRKFYLLRLKLVPEPGERQDDERKARRGPRVLAPHSPSQLFSSPYFYVPRKFNVSARRNFFSSPTPLRFILSLGASPFGVIGFRWLFARVLCLILLGAGGKLKKFARALL